MATPTPDNAFLKELVADVEAYLQRCSVLTDFAEGQVEDRVRLARIIDHLAADREGHVATIAALEARLRALEGSVAVRIARVPHNVWRRVRRSPPS